MTPNPSPMHTGKPGLSTLLVKSGVQNRWELQSRRTSPRQLRGGVDRGSRTQVRGVSRRSIGRPTRPGGFSKSESPTHMTGNSFSHKRKDNLLTQVWQIAVADDSAWLKHFVRKAYDHTVRNGTVRMGWFPSWTLPEKYRRHAPYHSIDSPCSDCGYISDFIFLFSFHRLFNGHLGHSHAQRWLRPGAF